MAFFTSVHGRTMKESNCGGPMGLSVERLYSRDWLRRASRPMTLRATSQRFIPANFTNVNGTLYFTATTAEHGRELWKSDGTVDGTRLVKDIAINRTVVIGDTGFPYYEPIVNTYVDSSTPNGLTNFNGTLFFAAEDRVKGRELWRTDGTEENTIRVLDIMDGVTSSSPNALMVFGNELFFQATDAAGLRTWRSDGTASGTIPSPHLIASLDDFFPSELVEMRGDYFFPHFNRQYGMELWKVNPNRPPIGFDGIGHLVAGESYTFSQRDFGLWDGHDPAPDSLAEIQIASLPTDGSLQWNNLPVLPNQLIAASQLSALTFTPTAESLALTKEPLRFLSATPGAQRTTV